jgi:hypothetical protein
MGNIFHINKNKREKQVLFGNKKEKQVLFGNKREKQVLFGNKKEKQVLFGNKRAQIASTLVWFTATIIIFFVMVLFLTSSIVYSGTKKVTVGWDEVKLEKINGTTDSQIFLFYLLNKDIEIEQQKLKLKDWLVMDLYNMENSKKAVLKQYISDDVIKMVKENNLNECYFFQAVSGLEKDPEEIMKGIDPRGAGQFATFIEKNSIQFSTYSGNAVDPRGASYISNAEGKLLRKATSIILIRDTKVNLFGVDTPDNQKVKVKFYMGAC